MLRVIKKIRVVILILVTFSVQSYSQTFAQSTDSSVVFLNNQHSEGLLHKTDTQDSPAFKPEDSTLPPLALGVIVFLYLLNPMLLFEDGAAVGLTKELSLGFGDFGEYRLGAEYSFVFRSNNKSQLRFSGNYDFILDDLQPSNMLQTSTVISLGGGFFTDFNSNGYFAQSTYGFSIRNDKLLIYPHVKARYTLIPGEDRNNIFDLSFGIIIGFANPFIDLKIRRKH